ncbi:MAG: glutamate-5-semialdehyde dehydrogenase [Clostridiales bacterium]|nr:glutamate-5-semialdehyde dehydrogenase [Clostridiales bacterium]
MSALIDQAARARAAWQDFQGAGEAVKNKALQNMIGQLAARSQDILAANALDVAAAAEKGLAQSFVERLTLNEHRLAGIAEGLADVIALSDPVGEVIEQWTRPNGLVIVKRRVPLGVVGIIYESRPNVTVDAAALCLKSGNAAILRGGSDALMSNGALIGALRAAIEDAGLNPDLISLVEDPSRETAKQLMTLNRYVDVLIPRGGKGLIRSVVESATVPVIQTGDGVCHIYVDGQCDAAMAREIAVSAKVSRPSVCNSAETLLVDAAIAPDFLPGCLDELREKGVEIRGCERTRALWPDALPATDDDWDAEYNAPIYAVRVVGGVDEAIDHINAHGTRHSEAIVTANAGRAAAFQTRVDAAAVYVNASTRFTDGYEFGLGAEIGISNQKLHARGPMGLRELTTYKYEITGDGQTR